MRTERHTADSVGRGRHEDTTRVGHWHRCLGGWRASSSPPRGKWALRARRSQEAPAPSSGHRAGRRLLLLVLAGSFLLAAAPAALAQVGYTGVDPPPQTRDTDADPYVGLYVSPSQDPGMSTVSAGPFSAPRPSSAVGGAISVGNAALGDVSPPVEQGDGLLTRSDLVTTTALGLTAVIAFAVATGRLGSRR